MIPNADTPAIPNEGAPAIPRDDAPLIPSGNVLLAIPRDDALAISDPVIPDADDALIGAHNTCKLGLDALSGRDTNI